MLERERRICRGEKVESNVVPMCAAPEGEGVPAAAGDVWHRSAANCVKSFVAYEEEIEGGEIAIAPTTNLQRTDWIVRRSSAKTGDRGNAAAGSAGSQWFVPRCAHSNPSLLAWCDGVS